MTIAIELASQSAFAPGEKITVPIAWELQSPPLSLELRLSWTTRGKGTTDSQTVQVVPVPHLEATGRRSIPLTLPNHPYSVTGRLVSIIWTLELVAQPVRESAQVTIVIAPERREIVLTSLPRLSERSR